MDGDVVGHSVAGHELLHGRQELGHWQGVGVQGGVDPALPDLGADLGQADVGLVEPISGLHVVGSD